MSSEDELSLEVLLDFFDCVEAGITAARQRIKEKKRLEATPIGVAGTVGVREEKLEEKPSSNEDGDFSKLFWEQKQGEKGPFEQTSEKTNNNSALWQTLKAKLKGKQGFCQHAGFKYWFDMQQETVVDRRKIEW